jgi:hypothetical protein
MDKGKLHHYWIAFRKPSLYILIACTVFFSALAIYSLRANNLKMLQLKNAVYVADEQNGDIEGALQELRSYVNGHMNTQLRSPDATEPPIQLINQFNRYIEAEQAKVANQDTNQIYKDAQAQCETGAIPLTARAQCIQDYIIANGGNTAVLVIPPKELYTFDFVSPLWSPDIAGFSIILAILSGVLLVLRLIIGRILKHEL